ncbi:50S ribosomal protein L23 [candidate division Kazan bacterium]|uniref:Large ribosomal subunit protein uL23 n=1 Tax=candidate division Kazan bacterium TaxID=2202143 RepID=A0A420ZDZ0_UNCK3|nr:MAG: 50S ribosomal protein L23 [candidate division Kazan bacterium]
MSIIIKKPIISEKSISQGAVNKYTFQVAGGSTKPAIAKAIEKLFNVTVIKVNTVKLPGKPKQFKRIKSYRSNRHHAVVTLKAGDKITLFEDSSQDKEAKESPKKEAKTTRKAVSKATTGKEEVKK